MPFTPILSCFRTFALVSASADPGTVPLLGTSSALRAAYSQHVFVATGTPKERSYRCSCAYPLRAHFTAVGNGSHEAKEAATQWGRRQTTAPFFDAHRIALLVPSSGTLFPAVARRAGAPVRFRVFALVSASADPGTVPLLGTSSDLRGRIRNAFSQPLGRQRNGPIDVFAHALCVPTPPQSATEATKQKRPPHGGAVDKQPHLSSIHAELHCLFQAVAHSFRPSPPSRGTRAHDLGPGWFAIPFPCGSFIRNSMPVYPGAFSDPFAASFDDFSRAFLSRSRTIRMLSGIDGTRRTSSLKPSLCTLNSIGSVLEARVKPTSNEPSSFDIVWPPMACPFFASLIVAPEIG